MGGVVSEIGDIGQGAIDTVSDIGVSMIRVYAIRLVLPVGLWLL